MSNELAHHLQFDDAALALNRSGKMSEAQQQRLQRESYGSLIIATIALVGLVWVLLTPGDTFANPTLMRGIYGGIAALIGLVAIVIHRRERAAIRNGKVKCTRGVPKFERRRSIRRISVDGVELWVTRGFQAVINDETSYDFYYLEGSPILLSAEFSPPET